MSNSARLFIGLMSGTSADGIDTALVRQTSDSLELIDYISPPYLQAEEVKQLNQNPQISLKQLAQLQRKIAESFAQAALEILQKNNLKPQDITAIGSHGQTIFHAPEMGMSLQIGHPAIIAKLTGIPTAADFRIDDMALGGQGAPLAPAFHKTLIPANSYGVIINLGGIANLSLIKPNGEVIGYDTGPANCLMDEVMQQSFGQNYDKNGELAAQGQVDHELLSKLLEHPYLKQGFPKSTGRETFNLKELSIYPPTCVKLTDEHKEAKNLLATLNQFTALSLAQELNKLELPENIPCYITGGGAYNPTLLNNIQKATPNLKIHTLEKLGYNPNALEAMMCAWLAQKRIDKEKIDLTKITGTPLPVILGGLWI